MTNKEFIIKKLKLSKELLLVLSKYHNTIYSGINYEKALKYFKTKEQICEALSKIVKFKVQIREPDESNQDKDHPYYIIEEINKKELKNPCQKYF